MSCTHATEIHDHSQLSSVTTSHAMPQTPTTATRAARHESDADHQYSAGFMPINFAHIGKDVRVREYRNAHEKTRAFRVNYCALRTAGGELSTQTRQSARAPNSPVGKPGRQPAQPASRCHRQSCHVFAPPPCAVSLILCTDCCSVSAGA